VKYGCGGAAVLCLVGGLLFGREAASYLFSSAWGVQAAIKDAVPIEFELRRARDLLEQIIPEMHANVRLIAQEEVEIAGLKADIAESERSVSQERANVTRLRETLAVQKAGYRLGGGPCTGRPTPSPPRGTGSRRGNSRWARG